MSRFSCSTLNLNLITISKKIKVLKTFRLHLIFVLTALDLYFDFLDQNQVFFDSFNRNRVCFDFVLDLKKFLDHGFSEA